MPAGTGQSEPDITKIRELEQRLDNFRIQVSEDLTIRGSAWQGYALNVPPCQGDVLGACCVGSECHIVTAQQCAAIGGTFTGGTCDPNPCVITGCPSVTFSGVEFCCVPSFINLDTSGGAGACCHFDGSCDDLVTRDDCIASGGIYRGDGSTCVSNPCGSITLFEDSGRFVNGLFCLLDISPSGICDQRCFSSSRLIGNNVYTSEDCTGSPFDTSMGLEVYVVLSAGVYHVMAVNIGNRVILFYGTTTDLGTPATNEVVCGEVATWNNDLTTCVFDGPLVDFLGVAGNGMATIGSGCPTGACCGGGFCVPDLFEQDCVDLGGIWQGADTTCDPNPC